MRDTSDEELMRAVRDGDADKLGLLFERHHARIHGLCYRLTRDADVADDLAQETFLRVLRYRDSFRGDAAFTTWLYRVAYNVCHEHWRQDRRDESMRERRPDIERHDPVRALAPSAGDRARFDAAFRDERAMTTRPLPPSQTSTWMRRSLLAAGFAGALAIGYGASAWRARSTIDATAVSQSALPALQYLLLLYDTKASNTFNQSPGQIERTIAEYSAWARALREAGKLVSAEKLRDEPSEWFGGEVSVVGGDRLGGFFLIRVRDAAEARRIAEACPHLKHGGRVELRAIHKT